MPLLGLNSSHFHTVFLLVEHSPSPPNPQQKVTYTSLQWDSREKAGADGRQVDGMQSRSAGIETNTSAQSGKKSCEVRK